MQKDQQTAQQIAEIRKGLVVVSQKNSEIISSIAASLNKLVEILQLQAEQNEYNYKEFTIGNDGTGRTLAQIERDADDGSQMRYIKVGLSNVPVGHSGD